MLNGRRALAMLVMGLLLAACQATPSPTPSAGESVVPFVTTSYPADAPADCAYGGEFAQIKAVDRLTVELSLCYPDPAFLAKLAMPNNVILDSDWLAKYAANQGLATHANGTGPYRISEGAPVTGQQITLTRFDGYWGTKASAATVAVQWNPNPAERLLALTSGRADGIDAPAPTAFATIQGDPTIQLQPRKELSTIYVAISNTYQPFDSLGIRQALAMGIDRTRIVDTVLPPGSTVADYFSPCDIEFGCVGDRWYDRDLGAATALLADPGFPGPLTTHIYYPTQAACGLPDPSLVATELQRQLNDDLGVAADLQPQAPATFLDNLSGGLLDGLAVVEACPDLPDVTAFLDAAFNDRANGQFGTVGPEIRNALVAADRTAATAARKAAYTAANNAIRDLVPMIPIAHGGSATAWKADVTGAVSSPVNGEQFAGINPGGRALLTWMQTASPASFYCADVSDSDSWRLCDNAFEGLYAFKPGTAQPAPRLAESCEPNQGLTLWTCHLRSGVTFHDGASLDANDVLASLAEQWDYAKPMHLGRAGAFAPWVAQFGPFLHAPAAP